MQRAPPKSVGTKRVAPVAASKGADDDEEDDGGDGVLDTPDVHDELDACREEVEDELAEDSEEEEL